MFIVSVSGFSVRVRIYSMRIEVKKHVSCRNQEQN